MLAGCMLTCGATLPVFAEELSAEGSFEAIADSDGALTPDLEEKLLPILEEEGANEEETLPEELEIEEPDLQKNESGGSADSDDYQEDQASVSDTSEELSESSAVSENESESQADRNKTEQAAPPLLAGISEVSSGTCGEDIAWTVEDSGILRLSGTGAMDLYPYNQRPWESELSRITGVVVEDGITEISDYAFAYNENLKYAEFADTVVSVGNAALEGCTSLNSVRLPSRLTTINDFLFMHCEGLTELSIPSGISSIGESAFEGCTNLREVMLPEGLTAINDYAFISCESLETVSLPESLSVIGTAAFNYCSNLTNVTYAGSWSAWQNVSIGENNSCLTDQEIHFGTTEPVCITEQPQDVFGIVGDKVTLKVTASGDGLTYQWYVRSYGETKWRKSTRRTAENATTLSEDSDGRQLYVSVTDQYGNTIDSNIVTLHVIISSGKCNDDLTWTLDTRGGLVISGSGELNKFSDHPGWKNVKTVVMEEGVEQIGSEAFYGASYITSVHLPTTMRRICDKAFMRCYRLKEINIPETVTLIEGSAFSSCRSLVNLVIPGADTEVGGGAFRSCRALESIVLPANLTSIGRDTLYYCRSLTSIEIPDSVRSIGDHAFYDCTKLAAVTIPGGVSEIQDQAFYGCSALKDVYFGGTEAEWKDLLLEMGDYNEPLENATVHFSGTGEAEKLKILAQPQNVSGYIGERVTLQVQAAGEELSYQWYVRDSESSTWKKSSRTTAYNSTVLSRACNGRQLYVEINDKDGNSISSDIVTLTVKTPLAIKTQPRDVTGKTGDRITVKVAAQGDGLTYQWYVRTSSTAVWKKSTCTKASNSTTLSASADGRQLYVVVSDCYGNSIKSDVVTLHVQ